MHEVSEADALRAALWTARSRGGTIGLVPTMGALHAGHVRLAQAARDENELVVMSIFVNPTQFGPHEDFAWYPRPLDDDRRTAAQVGIDVLFVPSVHTMYPDGPQHQTVWVDPGRIGEPLEGSIRPDHFRGVATVVAKLFNLVQPTRAYFGQKDLQQSAVVRRMIRDLAFAVELRVIPTVREPDGLALSSRNAYLSPVERQQANVLASALALAREEITAGERDAGRIKRSMRALVERVAPDGAIDYVEIGDLDRMTPVTGEIDGNVAIAVAVSFGATRLIDNLTVTFAGDGLRFS